jgi:hypothetical protein
MLVENDVNDETVVGRPPKPSFKVFYVVKGTSVVKSTNYYYTAKRKNGPHTDTPTPFLASTAIWTEQRNLVTVKNSNDY